MKKTSVAVVVVVMALVAAWGYRASVAQTAASPGPAKMGVVNIIKVLTECQADVDYRNQNLDKKKKISAELERMKGEADAIQKELVSALAPGSEEYNKRMQDWIEKMTARKAYEESQNQLMTALTQAWMEQLYAKMVKEIAKIAHQDNLDLVLEFDDSPVETRNPSELEKTIMNRKVLYNSANLDLTGRVMEAMNKLYEAEKAGKPPTAAPTGAAPKTGATDLGSLLQNAGEPKDDAKATGK
jgi:Skp family chaperone for outer membrane proteins